MAADPEVIWLWEGYAVEGMPFHAVQLLVVDHANVRNYGVRRLLTAHQMHHLSVVLPILVADMTRQMESTLGRRLHALSAT